MVKHTIDFKDMENFVHDFIVASSFGKGVNKSIKCEVFLPEKFVLYTVMDFKEVKYRGEHLKSAIKCYNEI